MWKKIPGHKRGFGRYNVSLRSEQTVYRAERTSTTETTHKIWGQNCRQEKAVYECSFNCVLASRENPVYISLSCKKSISKANYGDEITLSQGPLK
jgi:hypothetical protein